MAMKAFVSDQAMALLAKDSAIFDEAKVKEDPFKINCDDGSYVAILARVICEVMGTGDKAYVEFAFLWILLANSVTQDKRVGGTQITIRHSINDTEKRTKKQSFEYLGFDLRTLGLKDVEKLKMSDMPEVITQLNIHKKAGIIVVRTGNGYKNARLNELVKFDSIQHLLTPETRALLEKMSNLPMDASAPRNEDDEDERPAATRDQLDDMSRDELIKLKKDAGWTDIKTQGVPDDEVRALLRARIKLEATKNKPASNEDEDEDTVVGQPDPLIGKTRPELVAIKKQFNLKFKSQDMDDETFRSTLRDELKKMNVEAEDPNTPSSEDE